MHYNKLNMYLKNRFGHKLFKLSLDAGMTCPNRDGTLDTRGCIFCSSGGSGDFAASSTLSITNQLAQGKMLIEKKLPKNGDSYGFTAYFQAYTNTYAPLNVLEKKYMEAVADDSVEAISIATRPDCLDSDIINLVKKIHLIKPVFIELGLQTSNEATSCYIRRGYGNDVFEKAVGLINQANMSLPNNVSPINIVVHTIIGLPGETLTDMVSTIQYINKFPIHGIKLQLLHILNNTDLASEFKKNPFKVLSIEEYADILIRLLLYLRRDIIVHRITGDGPKKDLIAPLWSADKKRVLNYINKRLADAPYEQGYLYGNEE